MFEMKFSLVALAIVSILLGVGVYYTGNESERIGLRNNLRVALPEPVEVKEAAALPVVSESATPEILVSEKKNDVNNADVLAPEPQIEGIITEEAAIDVKTENDNLVKNDDILAVPLTAQTGAQLSTWIVIGASLVTGSLGLVIFPTVVARG